jgi:hypothetical protein
VKKQKKDRRKDAKDAEKRKGKYDVPQKSDSKIA